MKHLDDEDIARLVDGNIHEHERKRFLQHFAECEPCLKAYTDTLKFAMEEKKEASPLRFPIPEKIFAFPFRQSFAFVFQKKVFVPALAVLVVILVMLPFIVKKKITDNKIAAAKIQYIEGSIMKKEETTGYSFSPAGDKAIIKINAAIRAGFLIEDLHVVLYAKNKETLKIEIIKKLTDELRMIPESETLSVLLSPANVKRENFKEILDKIHNKLEFASLLDLYRFGRFVERSILLTFEDKQPKKGEIEKYLEIAQKYNLPPGVFKGFKRLKNTTGIIENREICQDIKEVFLGTR
jgi:hypothetical protein